ncbi:MAG: pyridoxal-phosphate dependent enzyme [Bacteroides sp.]|nr:pyridoxal-phosphate dependent enzyme [Bacteroides sp.]
MKHLPYDATPVDALCYHSIDYKRGGVIVKRDDNFGKNGGGSKARMLQYIFGEINSSNCEVLVTAGGPCSNFNRACALLCAQLGIRMHLVAYTEHEEEFSKSENYFICQIANVIITKCNKHDVVQTIASVMQDYEERGIKVKNVYGGGRSIEGIYAYYDAVRELKGQIGDQKLDRIFVACGTGTTASGILAGCQKYLPDTKVYAISVARKKEVEIPIIEENLTWLNSYLHSSYNTRNLVFRDDYISGEYGATTTDLINFIKDFTSQTGILVDPIYTGKALFGMYDILRHTDYRGMNLFWHTGAIYTLLSNRDRFL